ncbi:ABC transporter substrate-binding protein [Mesorhizobium sp. M6A.T.Cr.TU.016.01.1.1]|uniref:ABC transporter substrate-binding protein n=1 Tax=Mesorhizobium sp. M6A.T.Cr.TU.016.01.1.1 TaxID=2493677 RepID=UPI000F765742|nr:ABC transporter substrate-binding protein [Mesorhizobium sp. M6A.T.Cr.TU.016.01.1.1]AZO68071.1 ABC transporter substrate-binding protein [Mesorhizobium sp. M6A.T.Cr.TU.016.01.1.1]
MKQSYPQMGAARQEASHRVSLKAAAAMATTIALSSSVFAAGGTSEASRPSFLASGETLNVCNSPGFPPLSYFEQAGDAAPIGSDIDLLNALAKQWGVELHLVLGEFAGLLPALESGRCDMVMSGILVTKERQQKFDAVPYMKTSTLLLVAGDNKQINNLEDMSGKTLAVEAGTVLEKIAGEVNQKLVGDGRPEIQIQTYPKAQDCIEQVLVGRSDGTLVQDTEAAFRDKQMPGKLKTVFTVPGDQEFGIYLRKTPGDTDAVKAALGTLKASGFMAALPVKWHLPADATNPHP